MAIGVESRMFIRGPGGGAVTWVCQRGDEIRHPRGGLFVPSRDVIPASSLSQSRECELCG
jgi:hypothetical protein